MPEHNMTLEELKRHRAQAATLVKLHGKDYLPFFHVFHDEILRIERQATELETALQFASSEV
ncbi:hypothetical protein [Cohaesibacter haloalkalitolerans]|uniref:hypothetical protein n=1 Tax=Cohaesibacter haloalkalitolerans TaxID=1162980 RepID=UPI000E64E89D|nr:hypothetical protein [Cohaesibacter haloalkalitolerans]